MEITNPNQSRLTDEQLTIFKEKFKHQTGRRCRSRVNSRCVRKSAARLKVKHG